MKDITATLNTRLLGFISLIQITFKVISESVGKLIILLPILATYDTILWIIAGILGIETLTVLELGVGNKSNIDLLLSPWLSSLIFLLAIFPGIDIGIRFANITLSEKKSIRFTESIKLKLTNFKALSAIVFGGFFLYEGFNVYISLPLDLIRNQIEGKVDDIFALFIFLVIAGSIFIPFLFLYPATVIKECELKESWKYVFKICSGNKLHIFLNYMVLFAALLLIVKFLRCFISIEDVSLSTLIIYSVLHQFFGFIGTVFTTVMYKNLVAVYDDQTKGDEL